MPAKWKKSHKEYKRGVASINQKMIHYYLHATPKEELIAYLNNPNGKPKKKQQARNELTRRGVKIVWTIPQSS
tara:strand:- start:393 stop:611 length:219 start_codon:yes stop_codon:yes gene_type:complete